MIHETHLIHVLQRRREIHVSNRHTTLFGPKPLHGKISVDLLFVGGLLLGWVALQTFVLPGMGVST